MNNIFHFFQKRKLYKYDKIIILLLLGGSVITDKQHDILVQNTGNLYFNTTFTAVFESSINCSVLRIIISKRRLMNISLICS